MLSKVSKTNLKKIFRRIKTLRTTKYKSTRYSNKHFQVISIIFGKCGWYSVNELLELSMTKNEVISRDTIARRGGIHEIQNVGKPDHCIDFIIDKWDPFQDKMELLLSACGKDRNKGKYD